MSENCTITANNIILNHTAGDRLIIEVNDNCILTANGNIDFNAASSGLIEIKGNDNSQIRIAGNFDRTPNNFGDLDMDITSTLEFFGSTNTQVFPRDADGGGDSFDYGQVILNNSFGTNPQVTMEGLATVYGGITWTDGVVASTATNLLVIDDNATSSIASNGSHCDGPIKKIGDVAFTFPTGDNDYYGGIEINDLSGENSNDEFTAQYFEAMHPETYSSEIPYTSSGGITDNIKQTSRIEWWELTRDNGVCEPIVRLYWTSNVRSQISDLSSLVVAHYLGAQTWQDEGGNNSGALAAGYVESTGNVTSFSPFTFGSTDEFNNDLPIELVSFDAIVSDNDNVDLNWETASEINNDYFEIEKTIDLQNWTFVNQTNGAGNSNTNLEYATIDYEPYMGDSYYRLKQVDFDGTTTYSDIRKVTLNMKGQVTIYPNPSSGIINIEVSEKSDNQYWTIYDGNGRIVGQSNFNETATKIDLSNLATGIYVIKVTNGTQITNQKISILK